MDFEQALYVIKPILHARFNEQEEEFYNQEEGRSNNFQPVQCYWKMGPDENNLGESAPRGVTLEVKRCLYKHIISVALDLVSKTERFLSIMSYLIILFTLLSTMTLVIATYFQFALLYSLIFLFTVVGLLLSGYLFNRKLRILEKNIQRRLYEEFKMTSEGLSKEVEEKEKNDFIKFNSSSIHQFELAYYI
jgi:hypothetical protein